MPLPFGLAQDWRGVADHLRKKLGYACTVRKNIAAVIVEPLSGLPLGVILRQSATSSACAKITLAKQAILLIFDEVITAYGRVGAPSAHSAAGSYAQTF